MLQSKGNQTMKFGQLIEYNQGNIFLQKPCSSALVELYKSFYVNFVTFAVLKILDNIFSMQNSLNANIC